MKVVTSSRRQIVMAVLLAFALLGAAMRHWADNPSIWRDVGTLLLVLWLPAVGNLVAFVIRKLPRRMRVARDFDDSSPFTRHFNAELTPVHPVAPNNAALDLLERRCTLVVGRQGFTARLEFPLSEQLTENRATGIELLSPVIALRSLRQGAAFHVLAAGVVVAKGRVI